MMRHDQQSDEGAQLTDGHVVVSPGRIIRRWEADVLLEGRRE
jgi:hypothetical protein